MATKTRINDRLRWCGLIIASLLLFGVLTFVLLHVVLLASGQESGVKGFGFSDFDNVLGEEDLANVNWMNGHKEDPYLSDNSTQVWANNGNGLELEVLNALDESWQPIFLKAMSDWSDSQALKLYPRRVDVDHSCSRVQGAMKVCNANLGETGYLGFNEVETIGDVIVSSVAQMNEYYLYNADATRRQYTLCHELGHGFGLPHTDENPYNDDLGNCMDYTLSPENNLHPGKINFQRLSSMYLQDDDIFDANGQAPQYQQGAGQSYQSAQAQYQELVDSYHEERDRNEKDSSADGTRSLRRVIQRSYILITDAAS